MHIALKLLNKITQVKRGLKNDVLFFLDRLIYSNNIYYPTEKHYRPVKKLNKWRPNPFDSVCIIIMFRSRGKIKIV